MEFLASVTAISAASVVVAVQVLKMEAIPVKFVNKYPALTNIIISFVAATIATLGSVASGRELTLMDYLFLAVSIPVVASITYNQLGKKVVEETKPL